ncbi:WD40 repeat-like protein [Lindgomyces ingoldianus]|uniref:WD40 repeat-like protein n=1 Tax=Lindgomyces ingoldianus TaxID=673940 RepID=A0ACB6R972_9PLEO|nr:WD40 repeat-like protein [Lindgomyces ingoldianus]KAF2474875.1 WD40 repeat-like protein [Lindgomyces ingoldianus]
MGKRKRDVADETRPVTAVKSRKEQPASTPKLVSREKLPANKSKNLPVAANGFAMEVNGKAKETATDTADKPSETTTIQIITGSYERVLHGFTAALPRTLITRHGNPDEASKEDEDAKVNFSDTFLFNAHASAIRCLALSPPSDETSKITLATGSTDERINVYSLSTAPPLPSKSKPPLPTLHGTSITQNSKNKELGSLLHHSSSITALYFPTRSKLLSSAEDSTITITRTRDWTPLSTIKAPIPKPQGRPSGDTAAPGEVPAGINDFAVHPSMKLMVSVGKGEKCMRLWNLVTGKKAGVLNFGKEVLVAGGEGRFGSGEGRRVAWDAEGEEFVVAFERGAVIFGIDSKPKAKVMPTPRTKLHQMHYLPGSSHPNILAASTEDGRIMLYETSSTTPCPEKHDKQEDIPTCTLLGQLGGPAAGITGRVKDFSILPLPSDDASFLFVTGSSDGSGRIWLLSAVDLQSNTKQSQPQSGFTAKQVGKLLGTYSTGNRITCLESFIMTGKPDKLEDVEREKEGDVNKSSSDEGSDSE